MILTQILQPTCVKVPLDGKDKDSAITELVELLAENGQVIDKNVVLEAVLVREQTRSTGIGSGIAIPHGKCSGVKELVMSMGITKDPITVIADRIKELSRSELKKQAEILRSFLFEEKDADLVKNAHEIIPPLLEKYQK